MLMQIELILVGLVLYGINNWLFWPIFPLLWSAGSFENPTGVYLMSFFLGILGDLLFGGTLGHLSLILLGFTSVVFIYRLRVRVPVLLLIGFAILSSFILKILWG